MMLKHLDSTGSYHVTEEIVEEIEIDEVFGLDDDPSSSVTLAGYLVLCFLISVLVTVIAVVTGLL